MAKSARASSKKVNHTKLRARVFGPVEKARAERIHAKLLETIRQPKPEKTEMDTAEDSTTTEATKEDDFPKGSSVLTAPVPRSLSDPSHSTDSAQENCEIRNLCFYLGLCSDIVGFNEDGDLKFAFDPLPPHWLNMDVDGAAKAAPKKRGNKDKSQSKKQQRRKPQNKMTFPASRGKGALKPFTGGRVNKRR
ncbi:hypothetical protein FB567DRAFT_442175 [Paraphoma chrysanthemicola]|uniref:DUF2423 domain-containing protein n=1 Tax=Paraphoma chrysanthemicola TaxID=798071 RepID=A0A8K0R8C1_9PLEO|nr:hypothetical protein FB567DRAFT_442175 [Paraphoma chrysanthemicola]